MILNCIYVNIYMTSYGTEVHAEERYFAFSYLQKNTILVRSSNYFLIKM